MLTGPSAWAQIIIVVGAITAVVSATWSLHGWLYPVPPLVTVEPTRPAITSSPTTANKAFHLIRAADTSEDAEALRLIAGRLNDAGFVVVRQPDPTALDIEVESRIENPGPTKVGGSTVYGALTEIGLRLQGNPPIEVRGRGNGAASTPQRAQAQALEMASEKAVEKLRSLVKR